jgi:hypothetical protein
MTIGCQAEEPASSTWQKSGARCFKPREAPAGGYQLPRSIWTRRHSHRFEFPGESGNKAFFSLCGVLVLRLACVRAEAGRYAWRFTPWRFTPWRFRPLAIHFPVWYTQSIGRSVLDRIRNAGKFKSLIVMEDV